MLAVRAHNVGARKFGHQFVDAPYLGSDHADAFVDKSGKKFAPKAPARRAPAPASTQTSARQSLDRQLHSQTPQPQNLQQHVASSPTPSISLPEVPSSQQPAAASLAKSSQRDEATLIPIPSRRTPALKDAPPAPVPQKRPLSPLQQSRQLTSVSQPPDVGRALGDIAPVLVPNGIDSQQTESHGGPLPISAESTKGGVAEAQNTLASEPAAKRRKVEKPSRQDRLEQSHSPIANASVIIPSTGMNKSIAKSSSNTLASVVPRSVAKAARPGLSAQEKRKQQIAHAAAEVVADATKSPSARATNSKGTAKGKGIQRNKSIAVIVPEIAAQDPPTQSEEIPAAAKTKRKYTKRRKPQKSIEDAAAEVVADAVQGSSKDLKKGGRRRRRAPTPEGAETMKITPSEVRMMDLCRDGGTGRKSEREKELEELERAEFIRNKQRQLEEVMSGAEGDSQATPLESTEVPQERLDRQREQEESVAHNVPNTVIVNGQIQIDETSLEIDRHAAAALERNAEQLDAVDETEMTRKINSATWLKRDKSGGWNEMLTDRFYDGLRMFGTDFEMISKMFPGRTRHKIKLKFCKEEKVNGNRIKATLLGEKLAVDLPELEKIAGTEFDDPEELEKDLEEDRIRLQEETAAEKQALDEAKRERQEQIAAEQAAAENDSSAKENRRGRGKKKGSKRKKGEKNERNISRKRDKHVQRAAGASTGDVLGDFAEAT